MVADSHSRCAREPWNCRNGAGAFHPPRNSAAAMQETRIMLAYSARKKNANRIPLYSVKKPATNSLSASGRSNGSRLVSATAEMTYTTKAKIWGNGGAKSNQFQHQPDRGPWTLTRTI